MPEKRALAAIALAVASLLLFPVATALGDEDGGGSVSAAAVLDDDITYQGRLVESGSPANGVYDFQFVLYDDPTGGAAQGSVVTLDNVVVQQGLFSVELAFGPGAFDGDARWLEVRVRPGISTGTFQTLSPRQPVTATPYALVSKSLAIPFAATADVASEGLINLENTGAGNALFASRGANATPADTIRATNAGAGAALRGTSTNTDGRGVLGDASGANGIGGEFKGATALQLDGALRVTGNARPAFVQEFDTGSPGNDCSPGTGVAMVIDNPFANGDPDAILLVTPRTAPIAVAAVYNAGGDCPSNRWVVLGSLTNGDAFNILVIKASAP